MSIRTQLISLLQIICESMLYSDVITVVITVTPFKSSSWHEWVKGLSTYSIRNGICGAD